ncbi:ARID DNA-binding domain-containing protein [Tanacetum coccineum]
MGRPPRRIVQTEFVQRRNKREEEERLGRCMRRITRDCRNMLKKKLEEIEVFNASKPENKYVNYNCFYCNKDGHITKSCPIKTRDDALGITEQKYPVDKSMILCFNAESMTPLPINVHLVPSINPLPSKEEFLVDRIEGQKKFLFTYGIGEVIINNEKSGCMIPGVHYAPEITLNILSIDLLRQQGFELIFEEGKCTLEYMFKTKQGKNLDVDRMKQMHNNYLDDYFESLDKERIDREVEKARFLETTEQPEVHNFHGFVDFLDLIKKDEIVRLPGIIPPTIDGITIHLFDLYKLMENMGGYLSVHFGLEFGALAEVLGLTRSDGEKIRKCYETYLEVFVSYYKTARAPQNPIRIGEGSESLEEY